MMNLDRITIGNKRKKKYKKGRLPKVLKQIIKEQKKHLFHKKNIYKTF